MLTQDDAVTTSGAKAVEGREEVSLTQAQVSESKGVVASEKQSDVEEIELIQLRAKRREVDFEGCERVARQVRRCSRESSFTYRVNLLVGAISWLVQDLLPKRLHNTEWSLAETAAQAVRWEALQAIAIPQKLQEALFQQQLESASITNGSDSLAAKMWELLNEKDEAFVQALQTQAYETEELLHVLARQSAELQSTCAEQLRAAEFALKQVCRYS